MTTAFEVSINSLVLMLTSITLVTVIKIVATDGLKIDHYGCYENDGKCDRNGLGNEQSQNAQCKLDCEFDNDSDGKCNYRKKQCCCTQKETHDHLTGLTSPAGKHESNLQLTTNDLKTDQYSCYENNGKCDRNGLGNEQSQNAQCKLDCEFDNDSDGKCNYLKNQCCCTKTKTTHDDSPRLTSESGTHGSTSQLSTLSGSHLTGIKQEYKSRIPRKPYRSGVSPKTIRRAGK